MNAPNAITSHATSSNSTSSNRTPPPSRAASPCVHREQA